MTERDFTSFQQTFYCKIGRIFRSSLIWVCGGLWLLCFLNHSVFAFLADPPSTKKIDFADQGRPNFHLISPETMPQISVMSMAFDQKGYLWIGTQDGAAYFNGYRWVTVNMPDRRSSNNIYALMVAGDGSIWFGTQGSGIAVLREGKWTTYNRKNGTLKSDRIRALLEERTADNRSIIWVGTSDEGLSRFENGKWQFFTTANSNLPSDTIQSLALGKNKLGQQLLWLGTPSGLACLQENRWQIFDTKNSNLPNDNVTVVHVPVDNSDAVWVGTEQGLGYLKDNHWTVYNKNNSGLSSNIIRSILVTVGNSGQPCLWVGTFNSGLARFETGQWQVFNSKNSLLTEPLIRSLISQPQADGSVRVIIGSSSGVFNFQENRWFSFDNKNSPLPHLTVYSALKTSINGKHSLWVGTEEGLCNYQNGQWRVYQKGSSQLPENAVELIYQFIDSDGELIIWLGLPDYGLVSIKNDQWKLFNTDNSSLPDNHVQAMTEVITIDGHRSFWLGTSSGLFHWQDQQGTTFNNKNSGLPQNNVVAVTHSYADDGQPIIWAGTYGGGLARLHNNQWTIYNTDNSGLPNNQIYSLMVNRNAANQEEIWIGTNGGGVARFQPQTNQWLVFSDNTNPALPNNTIYSIHQDSKKRIYLFTNKGIARLTPGRPASDNSSGFEIYTFTTEDGLPANECNLGTTMIDKEGRVWANTIGGLGMLDTNREFEDKTIKPLYIERTLLNGKTIKTNSTSQNDQSEFIGPLSPSLQNASLSYKENNIRFEFSLLSYFKPSETRYRSQLLGAEEQPTEWVTANSREFPTLPDGDYTFQVWAKDYAGNISGPVSVTFIIRPAPWRSWPAYFFYTLAMSSLIYGGYRYNINRLEQRNLILEERVVKRTAELAQQKEELARQKEVLANKNQQLSEKNQQLEESHRRADRIFSALAEALPGTILDDKYRLDEKIGSGGFGAVYRGTHLAMRRAIAVKIFRPQQGNDSAEALHRFKIEAVSASRINHPNAVAVLDSGISAEGIAYIVMELLQGHTLKSELKRRGTLSLQRCAQILLPVCDVLTQAHAAGILHRDIKPDNIFLHQTEDGEVVKLVDFGIAKLTANNNSINAEGLTGTGGFIGTPVYMAPERFSGNEYDGRSDVYSVGVVFYQMLCGQLPLSIDESGLPSFMLRRVREDLPSPSHHYSAIEPEVDAMVMRVLSRQPELRPTAPELAQKIASLLKLELELRTSGTFRYNLAELHNLAELYNSEELYSYEEVDTISSDKSSQTKSDLPTSQQEGTSSNPTDQFTQLKPTE